MPSSRTEVDIKNDTIHGAWAVASRLVRKSFKGDWIGRHMQAFWNSYPCTSCWRFLIEHSMKQQEFWPSHSSLAVSMRELDAELLVLPLLNLFSHFGTGGGVWEGVFWGIITQQIWLNPGFNATHERFEKLKLKMQQCGDFIQNKSKRGVKRGEV